ncbi:MAG: molybdopterin converting factor subunit 1 [Pseudohongiellaceae bacterium]|nr:molybdopterin converting factor subunit 1 [Pseudohongiellaceae bacterium]
MLKINLFASLREQLGVASLDLELPEGVGTVGELSDYLAHTKGDDWRVLSDSTQVLIAVNQEVAKPETAISANSEVAFFPPMTGG